MDGHKHRRTMSKPGAEAWWCTGILIILCIREASKLNLYFFIKHTAILSALMHTFV